MKNKVEAILFTLGKFISIEELARILNTEKDKIKSCLNQLEQEYSKKDTALEIQKHEDKYKLNIKKEHGHLTNKLLANKEFDSPTTKTLAIIAYKNPTIQAEIIKIRGNKAYDHIKSLIESNLVTSEKYGRTRLLKLTQNFYDYFDISEKELKQELSKAPLKNIDFKKLLDQLPKPIKENTNLKKE